MKWKQKGFFLDLIDFGSIEKSELKNVIDRE